MGNVARGFQTGFRRQRNAWMISPCCEVAGRMELIIRPESVR